MTSERTAGVVPLHHQIADDLRARIAAGEFKPGDRLPSVRVLRERWGCSDGPVREAYGVLLQEGRITSSRGAPARVRTPPERKSLAISFDSTPKQTQKDLALRPREEREAVGATELTIGTPIEQTEFSVSYERVPAGVDLGGEFSIDPGTEILQRSYRTVFKDTQKLALSSTSYIPVALIEGNPELFNPENEPWPGGHWHQLYTVGIEIDRLENTIVAMQPTTRQRQDWDMPPGVPLLCLRSRSIDTLGRTVEISDSTYPADRTQISFAHQLRRWDKPHSPESPLEERPR
ncbi:GntR family transcriptional regulator [Spirillospora sp. CA-128828]|uniref:GntR family transcriptional regulator n=1 Tax=Spirillospora sp. CA-128828 TaxID=3240033 RepID=UPI003D900BB6